MVITELKLKNFMNIADAHLHFNEGINVLGGDNGQGKSAVLAAAAFCLTESKRGDSWKDFIKTGTEGMTIDMTLYKFIGDAPMYFHYEGLSSSASMTKELKYKSETYLNAKCSEFIEKYFDMDMMENVIFHLQDAVNIASIAPFKRRELLKKIFKSEFTEITNKVKLDIQTLKDVVIAKESQISLLKNKEYKIVELIPISTDDKTTLELNKIIIENRLSEISSMKEAITSKKQLLSQATQIYNSLVPMKKSLESQITSNSDSIRNSESLLASEEEKLSNIISSSMSSNIDLEKMKKAYDDSLLESTKLDEAYGVSVDEKSKTNKLAIELGSERASLFTQLGVFDTQPTCPTCGQSCDKAHKESLVKNLNTVTNSYNLAVQAFKEAEANELTKKSELLTSKNNNTTLLLAVKTIESKISNTAVQKKNLEEKIVGLKALIESYSSTLTKTKEQLENVNNDISINNSIINSVGTITTEVSEAEVTIKSKETEIETLNKFIKTYETNVLVNTERERSNKVIEQQQKDDKKIVDTLTSELILNQNEISDLDYVKGFYDTELPNHIMTKACMLLENEMNNFMNKTKSGFICKLVQNSKGVDFFYKARNEPEWLKAKMASGFEALLLTVAFKVSVAQAYSTKFIVWDEVDKTATENNSLKMFENINSIEGFDQMMLITHRPKSLNYLKEMGATIYMAKNGEFEQY